MRFSDPVFAAFIISLASFFTVSQSRTRVSVTTFAGPDYSNYALLPNSTDCPSGSVWDANGLVWRFVMKSVTSLIFCVCRNALGYPFGLETASSDLLGLHLPCWVCLHWTAVQ